jgi:hypothetical protein
VSGSEALDKENFYGHSTKVAPLPSTMAATLGKGGGFAECLGRSTRQTSFPSYQV